MEDICRANINLGPYLRRRDHGARRSSVQIPYFSPEKAGRSLSLILRVHFCVFALELRGVFDLFVLRYSVGKTPYSLVNVREKCESEQKPDSKAISVKEASPESIKFLA